MGGNNLLANLIGGQAQQAPVGIKNQTNQNQWWGGQQQAQQPQAATRGYGTYTPAPATGEMPPVEEQAPPLPDNVPVQPQQQAVPPAVVQKAQANIQRIQEQIYQYQRQMAQYHGTDYGNKIQGYIQQLQLDLQKQQHILSSGGGGYV